MSLPEELLTLAEAARLLRIAPKTLWNMLSRHRSLFTPARYQRMGSRRIRRRMLTGEEVSALRQMLVKEKHPSL